MWTQTAVFATLRVFATPRAICGCDGFCVTHEAPSSGLAARASPFLQMYGLFLNHLVAVIALIAVTVFQSSQRMLA